MLATLQLYLKYVAHFELNMQFASDWSGLYSQNEPFLLAGV